MARLIDADKTIGLLKTRLYEKAQIHSECREWGTALIYTECADNRIEAWINEMPTVDAVEVVRCKDCKEYIPCQRLPIGTSKWCDMFDRATCEMNYCGWGERRER